MGGKGREGEGRERRGGVSLGEGRDGTLKERDWEWEGERRGWVGRKGEKG